MTAVQEEGIKWTEDVKFSTRTQLINGPSFNKWVVAVAAQLGLPDEDVVLREDNDLTLKWKTFPMEHKEPLFGGGLPFFLMGPKPTMVQRRSTLDTFSGVSRGKVMFSTDVRFPVLGEYSYGEWTPWMSLAPMEVLSQRYGVKRSKGNVLVGGLGMGWLTMRVLDRKKVKNVLVIEKDKDIAKTFGPWLKKKYKGRLKIITGDFWENLDSRDPKEFDSILVDIWQTPQERDSCRKYGDLKSNHSCVWGWGHADSERW